jgi:hypothetical protein
MTAMRYNVAVDRLRTIAETCTRLASLWEDDPLVVGAHVFGELLEGGQRPERLQLAFAVDLPPEEVSWYTVPTAMVGFAATVGIDKYPCEWSSRPALWPVWNHRIRGPVRFWSLAGSDEPTLDALGERRLGDLHRLIPTAAEEAAQLQEELAASVGRLQRVRPPIGSGSGDATTRASASTRKSTCGARLTATSTCSPPPGPQAPAEAINQASRPQRGRG